jgi:hypothetical protein
MKLEQLFEVTKPKSKPYDKMSQEEQIAAVTKDCTKIRFIKQQSDAVQFAALHSAAAHGLRIPDVLTYIINPSENVQLMVAGKYPRLMGYIKNPTETVQQYIIDNTDDFIYIQNPSNAMLLRAVRKQGGLLLLNALNLQHFKEQPSKELINTALTDSNFIKKIPKRYEMLVQRLFKDNTVLMNKWLRYAENIRELG